MSVQSEIDRINENVANTYTALSEMGATMPQQRNSNNLPGTVLTVPQGGGSVQTDWNQMEDTAPDFLKNKPFGYSKAEVLPLSEVPIAYDDVEGAFVGFVSVETAISAGDIVKVMWDGMTYTCNVSEMSGLGFFGNMLVLGEEDTGEPFAAMVMGTDILLFDLLAEEDIVRSIAIDASKLTILDKTYLPYTVTTFYIFGMTGGYMYIDSEYTTVATYYDVYAAMQAGMICLYEWMLSSRYVPTAIYVHDGYVRAEVRINGKDAIFYTAEYEG